MVASPPPAILEYACAGANLTPGGAAWGSGDTLAYAAGPAVVVYDAKSCRPLTTLHSASPARVNCVAYSDDRTRLAAGGADGGVTVWDVASGEPTARAAVEPAAPVVALAWRADTLAAAAGDGVTLWRVAAGGDLEAAGFLSLARSRRALALALAGGDGGGGDAPTVLAVGHVDGTVSAWVRRGGGDDGFVCAAVGAGHGGWVRSVALRPAAAARPAAPSTTALLLASASNDGTARVWRLDAPPPPAPSPPPGSDAALDAAITRLAAPPPSPLAALAPLAVLGGHADWVTAVAWAPQDAPLLLTVSADRSARLWAPSRDDGGAVAAGDDGSAAVWLDVAAVGDAGVAAVGYVSGSFNGAGDALAAVGPGGAVHVWRRRTADAADPSAPPRWAADPAAGGHAGPVVDVAWTGADGTLLLTASADMTARLHGRLAPAVDPRGGGRRAEVGRPQVHGHPLAAVAPLPGTLVYASASEEKVVRVFAAPAAVVETLALNEGATPAAAAAAAAAAPAPAYGAAVPALGLSNKALHAPGDALPGGGGDGGGDDQYGAAPDALPPAAPAALAGRPTHAHLAAATLWPETAKLYGHGSEVAALAAGPAGVALLASAADARGARHAAVRLWRTRGDGSGAAAGAPIEWHALSVTGLAWSPGGGGRLLSVSRDRGWAVHAVDAATGAARLLAARPAAHARALTAGGWTAGGGGVVTAGRDGAVRVWAVVPGAGGGTDAPPPLAELPPFPCAVTALATTVGPAALTTLAVGTADGGVEVWRVAGDVGAPPPPVRLWAAPPSERHAGPVLRLAFAPPCEAVWGDGAARLASGGGDGGVRVWAVAAV